MLKAIAAIRGEKVALDLDQITSDLGFSKKVEGIYQKEISADQGYWIAAFDNGLTCTLSLGFIWYNVNRLAFRILREAFRPHRPEFSPEVGPALYMCAGTDLPRSVGAPDELIGAILAIQSEAYKRNSLSEAVSDALNVWPYQESHRILLPAAMSILGQHDRFQKYKALYLNAMTGSPLTLTYERYYELLEKRLYDA